MAFLLVLSDTLPFVLSDTNRPVDNQNSAVNSFVLSDTKKQPMFVLSDTGTFVLSDTKTAFFLFIFIQIKNRNARARGFNFLRSLTCHPVDNFYHCQSKTKPTIKNNNEWLATLATELKNTKPGSRYTNHDTPANEQISRKFSGQVWQEKGRSQRL